MRVALAALFLVIFALQVLQVNGKLPPSHYDHSFEWIENIAKSPYMFQQTVGLLEHNALISPLSENGLKSLHTEDSSLPVLMTADCPVDDHPYFPLHSPYMRGMRISVMIKHDVIWLYSHQSGVLAPTEIVSLANERSAIRFTIARVQSLHEYLPPGTMLLTKRDINRCLRSFEEFLSIAKDIVNSLLMYDDPFYPRTYREPYSTGAYCNVTLLARFLSLDGEIVNIPEIERLMSSDTLQTRQMVLKWISHYLKHSIRPYLLSDKCLSDTAIYRFYRRDVLDVYAINWSDSEAMQDSNISSQRFLIFQTPVNEQRQFAHLPPHEGADQYLIQQTEQHNSYINSVCVSRVREMVQMLHLLYLYHNVSFPSLLLSFLNDDISHESSWTWQCSNWIRDVFSTLSPSNITDSRKQSETKYVNLNSLPAFFQGRYKNRTDQSLYTNLRKSLNRALFSKQEDHMLDTVYKREGGGCSSTAQFTCLRRNLITQNKEDIPQNRQVCIWQTNYIHSYISAQITIGLALRPDPLWVGSFRRLMESTGITPSKLSESSFSVPSTAFQQESISVPRFLSVGLAGGSIHNFIRLHFPAAYVESVDIDVAALDLYLRYFQPIQIFDNENAMADENIRGGFETGGLPEYSSVDMMVCGIKYLIENTLSVNTSSGKQEKLQIKSKYNLIDLPETENQGCNSSYLIWANGYTYIDYLAAEIEEYELNDASSSDIYYDQVLFDAYDARALEWTGRKYEGISLSFVPQIIASLQSIRKILRPGSGLAQFHLHKDRQFKGLVQHIVYVFGGPKNIVMLDIGVESIVIAGNDVFATSPHPCDNAEEFTHWVKMFSKSLLFPAGMAESSQYALRCNWLDDINYDERDFSNEIPLKARDRVIEIDDTGNIHTH